MQHISFMQKLCRGIALVGQLGFSLITPPVVLLWRVGDHPCADSGASDLGEYGFAILPEADCKKGKRQRYAQTPARLRRSHLTTKGVCL